MTEWKEYKLGDVATFAYGKLPKKELLGKGNYITFSGYKYVDSYPEYNCEKRDVILVARGVGGTGDVKLTKQRCFLTNLSIKIVLDNSIVLNDYFYNMFRQENLRYLDSGSAQSQITIQDLANVIIEVPSVDVQGKITSIISSLDDKIDLLHRENATLEQMAETLFRQWFVVEAKEEWDEVRLEDIAILNAGGDKPKNFSPIRTKDLSVPIYSNGIDNEGLYGYTDKAKILEESVTISARGTIGYVVLRTEPFVPIVRLITMQPKDFVTSKFLYFWAKNQNINGTGTTQQQLTVPDFKQTKVLLPEKELIEKFTSIVNQYYNKILTNKQQINTLIKTRDGLLPRLMGGEIKI